MRLFDELRAEGVRFEMHSTGLLVATLSQQALEEEVEEHRRIEEAGYEGETELLDGDALRRLESALSDRVAGGLPLKSERHVRPESLVRGLVDHLCAQGAQAMEDRGVRGLVRDGRKGWRLETLEDDRVVVAAGVWSAKMLAGLGMRVLLEGAKGCSVTAVGWGTRPRHALKLAEARVACSHFTDGFRVTGTLDLVGMDSTLDHRRLKSVVDSTTPYLRGWTPDEPELEWAGLAH